jgi:hypothetical protein
LKGPLHHKPNLKKALKLGLDLGVSSSSEGPVLPPIVELFPLIASIGGSTPGSVAGFLDLRATSDTSSRMGFGAGCGY